MQLLVNRHHGSYWRFIVIDCCNAYRIDTGNIVAAELWKEFPYKVVANSTHFVAAHRTAGTSILIAFAISVRTAFHIAQASRVRAARRPRLQQ